jgi:hypothetical protein
MFDWDLNFKSCDCLLISKATTKRDAGDRNILRDDKKEITQAAAKYKFIVTWETPGIIRYTKIKQETFDQTPEA